MSTTNNNDQSSSSSDSTHPNTTTPPRQVECEDSNPNIPQPPPSQVPLITPTVPKPVMGISGVSAFHPYVRPTTPQQPLTTPNPPPLQMFRPSFPMMPPPPRHYLPQYSSYQSHPHLGQYSSSMGTNSASWFGIPGSQYGFFYRQSPRPMHVGGSSSFGGSGLRIGGGGIRNNGGSGRGSSPSSSRKRERYGETSGSSSAPKQQPKEPSVCSVCNKQFASPKALFGHMRTHPERGWRGAYPPPTFRAEEEFPNLNRENNAEVVVTTSTAGGNDQVANVGTAGVEATREGTGGGEEQVDEGNFKVPDLNNLPPQEESD